MVAAQELPPFGAIAGRLSLFGSRWTRSVAAGRRGFVSRWTFRTGLQMMLETAMVVLSVIVAMIAMTTGTAIASPNPIRTNPLADFFARMAPEAVDLTAETGELLVAQDGTIFPVVDGIIEGSEWSDAAEYRKTTDEGRKLTLYFKVVPLYNEAGGTSGDCIPWATNLDFTLPCGEYLFIGAESDDLKDFAFFIDEGNDGGYGSGSGDGVLTMNQEDYHEADNGYMLESPYCYMRFGLSDNCPEPACSPWTGSPCWQCVTNISDTAGNTCRWSTDPSTTTAPIYGDVHGAVDGYYNDYWAMMYTGTEGGENSWGWMGFVGDNLQTAEFLLPFDGLEGTGYCSRCDVSDASFAWGDVLNIMFRIPTLLAYDAYPAGADTNEPSTWVRLQIGGEAETEPGCQPSSTRSPLAGLIPFAMGLAALSWVRRHRR